MSELISWRKPNGTELDTNDTKEINEYVATLKWERIGVAVEVEPEAVIEPVVEPTPEPVVEEAPDLQTQIDDLKAASDKADEELAAQIDELAPVEEPVAEEVVEAAPEAVEAPVEPV